MMKFSKLKQRLQNANWNSASGSPDYGIVLGFRWDLKLK